MPGGLGAQPLPAPSQLATRSAERSYGSLAGYLHAERCNNPGIPLAHIRRVVSQLWVCTVLQLPGELKFNYFDAEGNMQEISVDNLTKDKKVDLATAFSCVHRVERQSLHHALLVIEIDAASLLSCRWCCLRCQAPSHPPAASNTCLALLRRPTS